MLHRTIARVYCVVKKKKKANVSSLILTVCVWLLVVALLLFGPHGCIQTPLEQQVFMSDPDIKTTAKEKSRLCLQVHAIVLTFL